MLHFRFFISLVSTKTKNLVTSLGIKASDVEIRILRSDYVVVDTKTSVLRLELYNDMNDQNRRFPVDITRPIVAGVEYGDTQIRSSTALNFSDWMNHIRTVFCYTLPPNVWFSPGCENYAIGSLKDAIGNVNKLSLSRLLTNISHREVLRHFNTPNRLHLHRNPFEDTCQIQQIFIQNFQRFSFHDFFSLDDLLLVNSEIVNFTHPISQKQLNQFLKHWIRGSSPRLQFLSISIDATNFVDGEVYLKGIRCTEMSEEMKNQVRRNHNLSGFLDMIQIRRKDGTPAAIGTHRFQDILSVYFSVLY
ncbi:hypothetical protein CRE_23060 [Caenorhabditis remanei]|uniref:Sdz-33 F-box domain-containing protein n=1 Tax=Caenorhabditis remanei TaxID=31234 RepID=E3N9G2_CAERE|nr:hypothetical protein CRE_23060 [Caenorhabditis remanei]